MNSFNKFILRLDTAEKRICKPEDGLTDNFQSVTQRKKIRNIQELWNNIKRFSINEFRSQKKREKWGRENIGISDGQEFYKINEDQAQKLSS